MNGSRRLRAYGAVVGGTASSQAISAITLGLVAASGSRDGDLLALGLQVGTTAISTVVISVVYLMAMGRPDFRRWRLSSSITAAFSIVVGALAAFLVPDGFSPERIAVPALFGCGGAVLAVAGVVAVRLACMGRAEYLAGLTIVPNLCVLILLLPSVVAFGPAPVYLPAAGWLLGCLVTLIGVRRVAVPSIEISRTDAESSLNRALHLAGTTGSSVVAAILPIVCVAAMATLEPGVAAVALFVTRVGSSVVTLGVNSLLMVRFNWQSEAAQPQPWVTGVLVAAVAMAAVASLPPIADAWAVASMALAWCAAVVVTPFVTRAAHHLRMGNAFFAKFCVEAFTLVPLALAMWLHPSPIGYFSVYIASSAIGIAVVGHFRARRAWVVLGLTLVGFAASGVIFGGM